VRLPAASHRRAWGLLLAALATAPPLAGEAAAQWRLELRPGVAVGAYQPTHAGLQMEPRGSLLLLAARPRSALLAPYAALGVSAFGCTEGFCAEHQPDFLRLGGELGFRVTPPGWPLGAWLLAGGTAQSLRSSTDGEWTGVRPGVTAGAGVGLRLGRLSLTPGLRYAIFAAPPAEPTDGSLVDLFVADVGIRLR
jgi:hypothetical protein